MRWYWSTDGDSIRYCKNDNLVPKTEGSKPMMELPRTIPDDVDWGRYLTEAKALAVSLGVLLPPPKPPRKPRISKKQTLREGPQELCL